MILKSNSFRALDSQKGHGHLLILLLLIIAGVSFVGYNVYKANGPGALQAGLLQPNGQTLSATAAVATQTVPASQEVTDQQFWKIIESNFAKPAQAVSVTEGVATKVTAQSVATQTAGKLLKFGGKGSGILTLATTLAFPESAGASPAELALNSRGASTDDLRTPNPASTMYSAKHSFDSRYYQYYVRVHTATGPRSSPTVSRGFGQPAFVVAKLSSVQRGDDDGCGNNGGNGHRYNDSASKFNDDGWVYFPDCRKDDSFTVSIVGLGKELETAKVIRTVSTAGKDRLIINIDYLIDDTTGSDSTPVTAPQAQPTEQDQCNELLSKAQAIAKNRTGAYPSIGGAPHTTGTGANRKITVVGIIADNNGLRKLQTQAKKVSDDCEQQFKKLWTIQVVLNDNFKDPMAFKRLNPNVRVTVESSGPGCKTPDGQSSDLVSRSVVFYDCLPGPFTITLSELGDYVLDPDTSLGKYAVGLQMFDFTGWKPAAPPKPGALPAISSNAMYKVRVAMFLTKKAEQPSRSSNSSSNPVTAPAAGGSKKVPQKVTSAFAGQQCDTFKSVFEDPAKKAKGKALTAKDHSNLAYACQLGYRDGYADTMRSVHTPLCVEQFVDKKKAPSQKTACDAGYHRGADYAHSVKGS